MLKLAKGLVLTAFAAAGAAQAHVTVQPKIALPGAQETLRFVVGHGCDGQPTTGLRVDFPAGVDQIQPQPKPGWSVNVQKSPAGAVEVIWTGGVFGPKAPDSFEVAAKLPARTGVLAFPAFQSCGPTVTGWTEAATPDAPKPAHPVPVLILTPEAAAAASASPPSAMPQGVTVRDGVLIDPSGLPLYTFEYDTMLGMSHCVGGCASTWRPFEASAAARPVGDWALIGRDDGLVQWTYKTKPLYTNAQDQPGGSGQSRANWRLAR